MRFLERDARVAYPAVSTLEQLTDGLAGVLDATGVSPVVVLGASFGGNIAQCIVRRHAGRVVGVITPEWLTPQG